jgi:hypothetical protein
MNPNDKPRVVRDFEQLPENIQEQVKLTYPYGYADELISFSNKEGKRISGLRFETDEKIYLIRMTEEQAEILVDEDEDFDDEGNLLKDVKDEYEEKYSDNDFDEGDESEDDL